MRKLLVTVVTLLTVTADADWKTVSPPTRGLFSGNHAAQLEAQAQETRARAQKEREEAELRAQAAEEARMQAVKEAYGAAATPIFAARDQVISALSADHKAELSKLQRDLTAATAQITSDLLLTQHQLDRAEHENDKKMFTPTDPYRMLNGKLTYAKGQGWLVFKGTVLEVQPNGICLVGSCGPPLEQFTSERELFIADFPYPVADHEEITVDGKFAAFYNAKDPTFTYTNAYNTVRGGRHTVRKLSFGKLAGDLPDDALKVKPVELPLEDIGPLTRKIDVLKREKLSRSASLQKQIDDCIAAYDQRVQAAKDECDRKINELPVLFAKAAKTRAGEKKQLQDAKILAWHQGLAEKGDAYGIFQMGRRYLAGDGVLADTNKAKALLTRAVEMNVSGAKDLLEGVNGEGAANGIFSGTDTNSTIGRKPDKLH